MKLKVLITLSYLLLFVLALVELIKYQGVVRNYLHVEYWLLLGAFLAGVLIWRITQKRVDQTWWLLKVNNTVVLPATAFAAVVTFGLESYTYANFVFSTFKINHLIFVDLILLSFLFKVVTATSAELKKWGQLYLLIGFLLICFFIYTYYYPLFAQISLNASGLDDDNLMEWLQILVLGIGVITSALLAKKAKQLPLRVLYILAALFFFVLAGEEISWGERLLSLNFSADANNYQNEFNFHNQSGVNEITALFYYIAFLYAALSWGVRKWVEKKGSIAKKYQSYWNLFTFRGVEVLYLLPTFIFNPYADRTLFPPIPPTLNIYASLGLIPDFYKTLSFLAAWRETFEVLFYLALVLHFWNILKSSRTSTKT